MRLSKGIRGTTFAAILAIGLIAPAGASAVDIDPTTTADEFNANAAACSLREAIEAASTDSNTNADGCPAGSGKDFIHLRAGAVYELSRPGFDGNNQTGDLDIRGGDLVIIAPQLGGATIDGNGAVTGERAIEIINAAPAIDVLIDNINVVDGGGVGPAADGGGGIAINGVTNAHKVTLIDMAISGNRGIVGGGLSVASQSTVELQDVTISGNTATVDGGGLDSDGIVTSLNSTITANQANSDGDFIGGGGGVYTPGGTLSLKNTILAGNSDVGQGAKEPECGGTDAIASLGNNLVGSLAGCTYPAGPNDQFGVTALGLLPLAQNGGPVLTHALTKGSPAVDKGAGCTGNDARDAPRVGPCDIGAYERAICGGRVVNVVGTSGKDKLRGTARKDGIIGLAGKDTLIGLGKSDGLCGGAGKDVLKGGAGGDRLVGGKGRDKCLGGKGKDREKSC
jgi:CSLREA domain-containing protein